MALTDLSQGVSGGTGIGINDLIGAEIVVYQTITLTNVANKYFDIPVSAGVGGKVKMYTMQGVPLQYGVDYIVSGTQLGWNGLSLDGLIEAGDVFQVAYFTTA